MKKIAVQPISGFEGKPLKSYTQEKVESAREKLKLAGREGDDPIFVADNVNDDALTLDDVAEDLTIVVALRVLLKYMMNKEPAQFTMNDSVQVYEMRTIIRKYEIALEESNGSGDVMLVIESDDTYKYWEKVIEEYAPKVFTVHAVSIKKAYATT